MSDLYLIAHKVRGEATFDVAIDIECPECNGEGCFECEERGMWWVIPTSGHRAYPWWSEKLEFVNGQGAYCITDCDPMPEHWPDHYPHSAEPTKPKIDISGLVKRPSTPIRRRV